MARPAGWRTNAVVNAGGLALFNEAYNRAGRGARGLAAGRAAVRRAFPGIGADVLGRVEGQASTVRNARQRYGPAGPDYQLPAASYVNRDCDPILRGQTGGRTVYVYSVEVEMNVNQAGSLLFQHVSRQEISDTRKLSKGEIESRARMIAESEARLATMAGSWRRFQRPSFTIGKTTITQAARCS